MPSYETLIPFFIATLVVAFMPGPAILYTAAQTLARGRRAGLMAALGIHVGCYVHVVAAALGLSAVFTHVPLVYLIVKLVGAAYLVWLGITMLRQRLNPAETLISGAQAQKGPDKGATRAFGESMLVEVLNPKVAVFFIAFLPQFVDAGASLPVWAQFMLLGAFVNIAFSSVDLMVIVAAGAVANGAKRVGSGLKWPQRIGGTAMIGLGIHVAVAQK